MGHINVADPHAQDAFHAMAAASWRVGTRPAASRIRRPSDSVGAILFTTPALTINATRAIAADYRRAPRLGGTQVRLSPRPSLRRSRRPLTTSAAIVFYPSSRTNTTMAAAGRESNRRRPPRRGFTDPSDREPPSSETCWVRPGPRPSRGRLGTRNRSASGPSLVLLMNTLTKREIIKDPIPST